MNRSARSEVRGERERDKDHPRNERFDTMPPGSGSNRQTLPWNMGSPDSSEEENLETYIDGSGI
jgi:hypothetical protein